MNIKTLPGLLALCIAVLSCNSHNAVSPYEEVLSRQPYLSLTDSIRHDPFDPDLYYRRGMLLFKNDNNPPALADLKKAWSLNNREVYAMAISNVLLAGKVDSAISFLQYALKIFPRSVPLH